MSDSLAESHAFTIVSDEKDWLSASWLLTRHRWLWKRLIIVSCVIWLFYVGVFAVPDWMDFGWQPARMLHDLQWGTGAALGLILLCIGLSCALVPFRVRKLFRASAKLSQKTRFEIDAKGLRSSNENATTSLAWLQFERWLENDRVLLLVVMTRSYFILPKSQIAPNIIDALRSALIAARVPHR